VHRPDVFPVAAMVVCYALEKRSHWFILAFVGAAALGAIYEFIQAAWPFGMIDAIFAVVALQRWQALKESGRSISGLGR
jgi:hypothetical protein